MGFVLNYNGTLRNEKENQQKGGNRCCKEQENSKALETWA